MLVELQASIAAQTSDAELRLQEIKAEAERHVSSVRQSETELAEHYGDIRDIKSVVGGYYTLRLSPLHGYHTYPYWCSV